MVISNIVMKINNLKKNDIFGKFLNLSSAHCVYNFKYKWFPRVLWRSADLVEQWTKVESKFPVGVSSRKGLGLSDYL